MVHIQVHGPVSFCRRVHGTVNIADRADDKLVHVAVIYIEILKVVHNALIDFHGFLKVRVAVRDQISFPDPVEIAHAAVSSALDPDILPEIVIA